MADNNDDPFAKYATNNVLPKVDEDDPFAKYAGAGGRSDPNAPGLLESFARGSVEGATFGYDDKFGFDKERREASRKANPWTHFMGELVGGAAPMLAATLIPTGVGQAVAAGRAAQLTGRALNATRAALVPSEIASVGQAIGQGAKLGAVYGGLSGSGHADVKDTDTMAEAAKKRLAGAAGSGLVGAVVGAPLGVAAHGVGKAAGYIGTMKAQAASETADLGQGALRTAARKLEADRITPDDLIKQIRAEFPDDLATAGVARRFWGSVQNKQPITADDVEEVVRRAMAGEDAQTISTALRQSRGGQGPGPDAVQTLLDELAARHLGPLNIVDRAAMVRTGSGDNTQMAMRAAAATPGEHLSIARENLLERQIGAGGRLGQLFDRMIGSADFDGVAAKHADDLREAGNRAYRLAYANEKPFDLAPVFDRWNQKYANLRGIGDDVRKAIGSMEVEVTTAAGDKIRRPPQTLEEFILARQSLRDAKDKAFSDGQKNLSSRLNELYTELDRTVAATNPDWWKANIIWRDGKAAEDSMQAGARMSTRLNASSRENLAEFTAAQKDAVEGKKALNAARRAKDPVAAEAAQARIDAANARQELFKVGLVRALNDMAANQGETHNLTKQLLIPGARQMLRTVLGKDADRFINTVRAEAAIHRTYQSQFGSQTTPLKEAVNELTWAPRFEAASANPLTWWRPLMNLGLEKTAGTINARRNKDLMDIYTTTDPLRQLEILRAMGTLQQARSNAQNAVGLPLISTTSGILPNVAASPAQPQSSPTRIRPYQP